MISDTLPVNLKFHYFVTEKARKRNLHPSQIETGAVERTSAGSSVRRGELGGG